MKVVIRYTVDVSDEYRRAVRRYYGDTGMATSKELRQWFEMHGHSMDDDVMYECGDKASSDRRD